jgi:hypothetical protein
LAQDRWLANRVERWVHRRWGGMLTVNPSFQKQPRMAGGARREVSAHRAGGSRMIDWRGSLALGEGGQGRRD